MLIHRTKEVVFFCLFEFTWVFFKCNSFFSFFLLFKQIGFVFINFAVDWSKLYTMRIEFHSNIHRLFTKISNKKWIWKFTFSAHWVISQNGSPNVFILNLSASCVCLGVCVCVSWFCFWLNRLRIYKQFERIEWPCRC